MNKKVYKFIPFLLGLIVLLIVIVLTTNIYSYQEIESNEVNHNHSLKA